jgi:hypothetical protein
MKANVVIIDEYTEREGIRCGIIWANITEFPSITKYCKSCIISYYQFTLTDSKNWVTEDKGGMYLIIHASWNANRCESRMTERVAGESETSTTRNNTPLNQVPV